MTPVVLFMFLVPLLTCCKATGKPVDCSDIFKQDQKSLSGVYTINPISEQIDVKAYCDMDTDRGRWTVIQRRMDGTVNFYRPWDHYVEGFGNTDGEYWLGLDSIHKISTKREHELLVEMEDFEGNKVSARFSTFSVGAECDGYKLTVSGFTDGGAGDALTPHNGMKFSTFDKDQDIWPQNCARRFTGGWWFMNCHHSNPNGLYLWGADSTLDAIGVDWFQWKHTHNYSLKSISMKIRPKK